MFIVSFVSITRINSTGFNLESQSLFKINFNDVYSIKKRPKGQNGIAWQRPTLAERKSDYHRR